MSARDAESGSSSYKGGSGSAGGLGNGGIGGGMGGGGNYGGGMGGGAGRNGGIGNRTGLTTGTRMYGGVARGRPGGKAMNPGAWGVRPQPSVFSGPLAGRPRPGIKPASIPGVNPVPEDVPVPPAPNPIGFLPSWYMTPTPWNNNAATWPSQPPAPTSEYWGVRMARPGPITRAISEPNYPYQKNMTPYSNSWSNSPDLGTGGFDNLNAGTYTGPGSRGWGGWNDPFR